MKTTDRTDTAPNMSHECDNDIFYFQHIQMTPKSLSDFYLLGKELLMQIQEINQGCTECSVKVSTVRYANTQI